MQKKIIALAVAGLMSGAAFAQSNVEIYGILDIGYTRFSSSDANINKTRNGIDHGNQSGSRLGFRGTEDMGGGMKASFVIETAIGPDTGAGLTANRQQFLALSNQYGTVAAGRMYTPQFNLLAAIDPFATTGVGSAVNTTGLAGGVGGVYSMGLQRSGVIRLDNLVAYVSPNFGGLTVTAGYTANAIGDEGVTATGAKNANNRIWAISPVYSNGPLMIGGNYHTNKNDAANAGAGQDQKVWDIGGTYDFGMVKVRGVYGRISVSNGGAIADPVERQWMIGLSAPVGASGTVLASYGRNVLDTDVAGAPDQKARKWSIGYTHGLSKRTNLYAAYGSINTNAAAVGAFSTRNQGAAPAAATDFTKGLSMGVRHSF